MTIVRVMLKRMSVVSQAQAARGSPSESPDTQKPRFIVLASTDLALDECKLTELGHQTIVGTQNRRSQGIATDSAMVSFHSSQSAAVYAPGAAPAIVCKSRACERSY